MVRAVDMRFLRAAWEVSEVPEESLSELQRKVDELSETVEKLVVAVQKTCKYVDHFYQAYCHFCKCGVDRPQEAAHEAVDNLRR